MFYHRQVPPLLVLLLAIFAAGVVESPIRPLLIPSVAAQIGDYQSRWGITLEDRAAVFEVFGSDGIARFEFDRSFEQVGLRVDTTAPEELAFRHLREGGGWSSWEAVDIYFSEGILHNGLILTGEPTRAIELRGGEWIEYGRIEFSERVRARQPLIRRYESPSTPGPGSSGELDPSAMVQGRAPADMVTSRHEWRAIEPDKICNSVKIPNRMTFHHTAGNNRDGDPHPRMRSTQSYHINDRGWCDIGYHFIVARNGEILQGRSRANRPGAHVEGQNDGNLGVGIFGNYVEVEPPDIVLDSVARVYHWAHETYGVPLNRDVIKGHREWPGTATQCPGDMGLPKLDMIVERANALGLPQVDLSMELSVVGLDDFYHSQSSRGVFDALPGDEFQVVLTLGNDSQETLRDVELAMEVGEPAIELRRILMNGQELEIPERGRKLKIGSLGRKSTHELVFELTARRYNFGGVEPESFNIWVKNVDEFYHQDAFGELPMLNLLGGRALEAQALIHILSSREWHLQGEAADDLEGWTATGGGAVRSLYLDAEEGLLVQELAYIGGGILGPEWTSIDADRLDELVLRIRSFDGPHVLALQWAREGEGFDESRQVRFLGPGDGEFHTLLVPLKDHPQWRGEVRRLHLILLDALWSELEFIGRYEVDQIYFQSREREIAGSDSLEIIDGELATVVHRGLVGPRLDYADGEGPSVRSNMGCSTKGRGGTPIWSPLVVGIFLAWRRWRGRNREAQLAA